MPIKELTLTLLMEAANNADNVPGMVKYLGCGNHRLISSLCQYYGIAPRIELATIEAAASWCSSMWQLSKVTHKGVAPLERIMERHGIKLGAPRRDVGRPQILDDDRARVIIETSQTYKQAGARLGCTGMTAKRYAVKLGATLNSRQEVA
jgi:hypothetical protein